MIVGLTGSIGMGKSTVAEMLRRQGIPVFDADAEVRRLQGPGGLLIQAIEAMFPGTTSASGVDRPALGAAVFGDAAALARLEALVHPAVARSRRLFLRRYRSRPIAVLDIPLLFETGGHRRLDAVLVVSAPAWKQRRRVLARPGMTPAKFARIRAIQVPDAVKRRSADFVIPTGGTIGQTRASVRAILACLAARRGR
ncbi:dephospho-CoA kinase [Sphingomonas vulcanisoli]|uniref:Dephospho-CoA kinase n=1 Tax=Sphingomonas vulcanisoli TaxID=1658060 RepID=A0ABX0TPI4_9SPHN|nr:dephospho-CoA kinase [Sphingomonas vulcanisoli]NIJ07412.1 dephospho-CoA kinase [Sphingomonas vulcanisoli]